MGHGSVSGMAKKTKSEKVSAVKILAQFERLARLSRAVSHASGSNPAQWDALRPLETSIENLSAKLKSDFPVAFWNC